jgi:cytochrome c oxidase subunit 2
MNPPMHDPTRPPTSERACARAVWARVAIAGAFVVCAVCGGCAGAQSVLDAQGSQARMLVELIGSVTLVCALVWFAVMIVLLRAIRRRRVEAAGPAPDAARERRMAFVVAGAAIATVLIVSALTVASFIVSRRIGADAEQPLVIRVRGWQWWWEVSYPGEPADRTLVTANEIHVPVGRPVRLELAAGDVIHSFWVPNLTGKQDMIPGRDNTLRFTALRAGTYRGQCAEFCGLQHAHMALVVIAQEPAEFDAWRDAQLAPAVAPALPELQAGQQVFMSKPCAACHAIRGTSAAGTLGPDLTHVGSRRSIAAGLFETTRGTLAAWIADPQTLKPGNNMPMVDLSADELQAVSAYLESLR